MRYIAPAVATAALIFVFSQGVFAQGVGQLRNGLPPTNMDSFVFEAGADKEHIYGDEGVWDIPPYFEFTKPHRINTGIHDRRDAGLTTGHGEFLPDAWGADEFIGDEWDQSGAGGGNASGSIAPEGSGPAQFGATMTGPTGGGGAGFISNAADRVNNSRQATQPIQLPGNGTRLPVLPFSTPGLQSGF